MGSRRAQACFWSRSILIAALGLVSVSLLGMSDCGGKPETAFLAGDDGEIMIARVLIKDTRTNCWVVWKKIRRRAIVIDPGGAPQSIERFLKRHDLELAAVVHTHGHWDHIRGTRELVREKNAHVYQHPEMVELTRGGDESLLDGITPRELSDGDALSLGGVELTVIHTPGHSPGSICLLIENKGADVAYTMFSGDLLFKMGVGRTDFEGGSRTELRKSLNERIAHLPDQTRVLPGHGPETMLGDERENNLLMK